MYQIDELNEVDTLDRNGVCDGRLDIDADTGGECESGVFTAVGAGEPLRRLGRAAVTAPALEMHVYLTSGRVVRFVQPDPAAARDLISRVHPQRLFVRALLMLTGSGGGLTAFPTGAVEQVDLLLDGPSIWPYPEGISDVVELSSEFAHGAAAGPPRPGDLYAEFEMRSGRSVHVRVSPVSSAHPTRGRVLPADLNLAFAHVFQRAVVWGRREEGGVFLLNPANIARLTAFPPGTTGTPPAALPAGYFVG